MEDKSETSPSTSNRTEFSDFVIKNAQRYFHELNMPPEQKERVNKKMLILPYGSVARGNASEVKSDLDLMFIENDASEHQSIMPLTDGVYHKDGTSLGQYIVNEYEKNHPNIRKERSLHVYPEYVGEIEVDNPHILVDDLINAIENDTLEEIPRRGGGHSNAAVLGLILNIDPQLAIIGDPIVFEQIKTKIKTSLKGKIEAEKKINEAYNRFVQWKNTEDD